MEAAGDTDLRVRCERLLEVATGRSAGESGEIAVAVVARGVAGGDGVSGEVHFEQYLLQSLECF